MPDQPIPKPAFIRAFQLGLSRKLIKVLLKYSPNDPALLIQLGTTELYLCNFEKAANAFQLALEISPNQSDALTLRGVSLQRLGEEYEAMKSYNEAIAIDPDFNLALMHRDSLVQQMKTKASRNKKESVWPSFRATQLKDLTSAVLSKPVIRFSIYPSYECNEIGYFPASYEIDCASVLEARFTHVPIENDYTDTDIVILTAHGSNLSSLIQELRRKLPPTALIVVWLWDNHMSTANNFWTAMTSDYVFYSHKYASRYLCMTESVLGTHIPACCGQWTQEEARYYFEQLSATPRSGRLLVNYVDYEFSERSALLHELKEHAPEIDVVLMTPDDRSRYFDKSRADRFQEWMGSKSTLILPVVKDLSTRVFDALLTGQVLLVPYSILDFDEVIPPAMQPLLGIIRLQVLNIESIRQAAIQAENKFDEMGADGVRCRHSYALEHHMLVHRVRDMLSTLNSVATGGRAISFPDAKNSQFGLSLSAPAKIEA